eukprot:1345281-Rhodomonas_salina.2
MRWSRPRPLLGTDVAYGATPQYAMSGTDVAYRYQLSTPSILRLVNEFDVTVRSALGCYVPAM